MTSQDKPVKVLVTASGSGGHLFPAVYVINELLARGVCVEFLGAGKVLEEEIIGTTGIRRHEVPMEGIKNRGLKGLVQFLLGFPRASQKVRSILSEFKPDVVVAFGGYVTFLPVSFAFLRSIPTWVHEGELKAGLANYFLSFYATKVSLAFPQTQMPKKSNTIYTGHPVRPELEALVHEEHGVAKVRNILVVGGSQGARTLDFTIRALLPFFKEQGLCLWHQCRKENYDELLSSYEKSGVDFKLMPFIKDMAQAYNWSDMVVSRAGAGAIMEIGLANRPAIFVPFPYAQGNHQLKNALTLVEQGKALVEEEGKDFQARLQASITKLLDIDYYQQMVARAIKGREGGAAASIAAGCLKLT